MGNKPQKTTETRSPYAPAIPALQSILDRTKALDPSTFTPEFSQNTQQGLTALGQLGQQPSATAAALRPIISGSQSAFQTGNNQLTKTAQGDYIGGNPYLDAVLRNANGLTADGVNSQYSAAGRYGSGAHTSALAREIGRQNTEALSNQYNTERSNQLNAAGSLSGQGFQGAALAPQLDSAEADRIGLQIAAGQGQDENAAATRLAPLAQLQAESSLVNPIAGAGGQATGTSVQQSNGLTSALGIGLGGLGALKSLGGLKGIASLFSLSDERAKENITEVGETHDGQPIYSYNYKGDPRTSLGLLAQDVEKTKPEAVGSVGGLKTVNYKMATKAAERGKTRSPSSFGALAS